MKQSTVLHIGALFLTALLTVLFTNILLYATEQRSATVTIIASVAPIRYIVVDDTFTIREIFSNTNQDVRPVVFMYALDGEEIPYSESVRKQYQDLKPTLNFSQPGKVYAYETRPVQALIQSFVGVFTKIFGF